MMKKMNDNYEHLAALFWESTGELRIFPCDLESAVLWVLPVAVVKLPRLGLSSIRRWLEARNIEMPYAGREKRIRACLLARCGSGLIFLDGADPEDEQRFSLAHDVAHFILDYQSHRQRAIDSLGNRIVEVLDGERKATVEERLTGILSGMTIGPFMHLMDRNKYNRISRRVILDIEDAAERFALELIAPQKEVERYMDQAYPEWYNSSSQSNDAVVLAARVFGIPPHVMASYLTYLASLRRPRQSFKDWIGWPPSER